MIGGEAMDLGGLLGRMMPDAIALVEHVLQQAQEQLTRDGALAVGGDGPSREVVVPAVDDRPARMIVNEDSSAVVDWTTPGHPAENFGHYKELVDRNSVLAAALGACDCWGHHIDCPVCDGIGGPGWALPDEQLFRSYVRPALNVVTNPSNSSTALGREAESYREEVGDVQYRT
jgi:hypothetical protein